MRAPSQWTDLQAEIEYGYGVELLALGPDEVDRAPSILIRLAALRELFAWIRAAAVNMGEK